MLKHRSSPNHEVRVYSATYQGKMITTGQLPGIDSIMLYTLHIVFSCYLIVNMLKILVIVECNSIGILMWSEENVSF